MSSKSAPGLRQGSRVVVVAIAFLCGMYFMAWVGFLQAFPHSLVANFIDSLSDPDWADVFVAGCSVVISAMAMILVWRTLGSTQEMVKSQSKMLDLEYRPLVIGQPLSATLNHTDIDGALSISLELANYGRLPALGGHIDLDIMVDGYVSLKSKHYFHNIAPIGGKEPVSAVVKLPIGPMSGKYMVTIIARIYYMSPFGVEYGSQEAPTLLAASINCPEIGQSTVKLIRP